MWFYCTSTHTYSAEHLRGMCGMYKKMYIRECLEQEWMRCAPWQCTQTFPKYFLLYKYTISWYARKYNSARVQKECTAFPEAISAQLTFSPLDLAYRLILRLDSEVWIEISLMEQLCRKPHNSSNSINFCGYLQYRFYSNRMEQENMEHILFTTMSRLYLPLHRFNL